MAWLLYFEFSSALDVLICRGNKFYPTLLQEKIKHIYNFYITYCDFKAMFFIIYAFFDDFMQICYRKLHFFSIFGQRKTWYGRLSGIVFVLHLQDTVRGSVWDGEFCLQYIDGYRNS